MRITFHPAKRDKTLAERGLDFASMRKANEREQTRIAPLLEV